MTDRADLPHLALLRQPHDRTAHRRDDPAWLDARWSDPQTRVLVVAGTRLRRTPIWVSPPQAPEGLRILLGVRDDVTHFAVQVPPADAPGDPEDWMGLRALLQELPPADVPLVFHALGLAEWHWAHRYCPRCGGLLESRSAGHVLRCAGCGRQQFPRSDPAVIMTVTYGEPGADDEMCLLGRQPSWPAGRYSTLAGFVEPGESMEDAVRREVFEEVGIRVGDVEWFGNQPWPFPSSLMMGFVGRATSTEISVDGSEIEDARWFTRAQMKEEAEAGTLVLPGGVSISRSLVEHWYGGPLPGRW